MMKKLLSNFITVLSIALLFIVSSCSKDDPVPVFGVAFETTALGISKDVASTDVTVTFSYTTTVENVIVVDVTEVGAVYGEDYETNPAVSGGQLSFTIPAGSDEVSFTVTRLSSAIEAGKQVVFTLNSATGEADPQITGNTTLTVSFDAISSAGATSSPDIGGFGEANQVYVDLSLDSETAVERTSWDLGFYSGSEDRVILNYSTYAMARVLDATDINAVTAADTVGFGATVQIGLPDTETYVDPSNGDISNSAIAAISATDSENKVYIINRGAGPGTEDPGLGEVAVGNDPLGWKKVRILKSGSDYVLQYADINATTFSEVTISKNSDYSFSYFSFDTESEVDVEPEKEKWDMVFTVATNVIDFGTAFYAYGYSDYVKTNRHGGVEVAAIVLDRDDDGNILAGQTTYDDFSMSDVSSTTFSADANVIGSSWRSVFSRTAYDYIFYVVNDAEGNYYKVQFLGLMDENGVRGNSSFKYELL